jgi:hypothetical protein
MHGRGSARFNPCGLSLSGSRGTLLKRQPVEAGGIEQVRCGPAVEPVTDIRRDTLLASYMIR